MDIIDTLTSRCSNISQRFRLLVSHSPVYFRVNGPPLLIQTQSQQGDVSQHKPDTVFVSERVVSEPRSSEENKGVYLIRISTPQYGRQSIPVVSSSSAVSVHLWHVRHLSAGCPTGDVHLPARCPASETYVFQSEDTLSTAPWSSDADSQPLPCEPGVSACSAWRVC